MYDPVNKAYSAAQHRLASFFETQTRFWKFGTWPEWAQDAMLGKKDDYTLRFNLFYFLTKNNLFAPIAKKWVLADDVDPDGELTFPEYPGHVWHDMSRLEKQAKDGSLFINDKPMMNMYENQVTRQGDLSAYAPYERWITRDPGRGTPTPQKVTRDLSPSPPGKGHKPKADDRPPRKLPRSSLSPRQRGVTYAPQPPNPSRRATSTLRFVRTSKEGRGKGFYVTSYLGRDYKLY